MGVAERVVAARKMAALNQRELASKIGMSAMAISKYESGAIIPNSAVLLKIAQATGVKPDFFFRPTSVHVSPPSFRRRGNLGKKKQHALLARVCDWLERYLEIESLVGATTEFSPLEPNESGDEMSPAENAAERLRKVWNLGLDPIANMVELLEEHGVKVELFDAPGGFDALTLWANGRTPVIAANQNVSGDRQRFNLAHELGHITLGPSIDPGDEAMAHRFAGAFLIPSPAVKAELGEQRTWLELPELHLLKHKYGVSMQAWIRRAFDVGVISQGVYQQMMRWMSAKHWRKIEPGDQVPPEKPTRLVRLVVRAVGEGVITESRAAELLGAPLERIWRQMSREHALPESRRR